MHKLYNSDFQKGVTKMVAQQPPSLAPPAAVGNDARKILWNILEYSGILKNIFCSNKILEDTNCHYPLLPLKRKIRVHVQRTTLPQVTARFIRASLRTT